MGRAAPPFCEVVRDLVDVAELRSAKDDFFRRAHDSPLTVEQRASFAGLRYFPEDAAYRFAVTVDTASAGGTDEVEMSDGSTNTMRRAGAVRFEIAGERAELVAYEQGEELFIPFRDGTSGQETYGAGRYVEAEPLGGGSFALDFNRAYNPYCAYNEHWRCPLPPRENWLHVPIRAGELSFH